MTRKTGPNDVFFKILINVSVKTRIESNSGASEISCINRCGFNFDVVPSLVGIWCPLISRVGDVRGAWGKCKAQRLDSEVGPIVGGSE